MSRVKVKKKCHSKMGSPKADTAADFGVLYVYWEATPVRQREEKQDWAEITHTAVETPQSLGQSAAIPSHREVGLHPSRCSVSGHRLPWIGGEPGPGGHTKSD